MAVPRKFDWNKARELRASGMTYAAIGRVLGVTDRAVRLACDDNARARQALITRKWQRGGVCEDCGTQISRNATNPAKRCVRCAGLAAAVNVRESELRCVTCREWKPDDMFPRSRAGAVSHRGRHDQCRACQTVARREYRNRNKVPCANGCGTLVSAPNEQQAVAKYTGRTPTGMCKACANATRYARMMEAAR